MTEPDQPDIDDAILRYYGEAFDEDARLTSRSPAGPLEFVRTQELLLRHLSVGSASAGRVLDVGGGTGRHSVALAAQGFAVELVDPVPRHVEVALAAGVSSRVGDARELPFADASFDGVLLLGPLYHLASASARETALKEAVRVCKPGGYVAAAALSRFVAFGAASLGVSTPTPFPLDWIDLLTDGRPPDDLRFPAGHFHTADELEDELRAAGLDVVEVIGVEGSAGLALEELPGPSDTLLDAALMIARASDASPALRELSSHLLGIGRRD